LPARRIRERRRELGEATGKCRPIYKKPGRKVVQGVHDQIDILRQFVHRLLSSIRGIASIRIEGFRDWSLSDAAAVFSRRYPSPGKALDD